MIHKGIDLLVIAPSAKKLYQKLATDFSAKEPNLWAGLLANVARKSGYQVNIFDLEIENPTEKDFYDIIETLKPKLILIVVTGQNPNASTAAMAGAVETSNWLKNNTPNYKIAFVGPHMSALPKETLFKHSSIDFVFTNEGVYTLLELLQTNFLISDLKKVKGLCFRDEDSNIILNKPSAIVPQNRMGNDLPGIAYDLMPKLKNYRTSSWHANYIDNDRSPFASIYTSLGCIFKCEFCMINIINRNENGNHLPASHFNTFRYWEPEFTIKQLDYLAESGVKQLKIADEMWVLNPKHFLKLCDLIIERDYRFNIWAYTRIDTIKPQYLDKLKQAGVNWLAPGIEAGNQIIRKEITKGKFKDINIREIISLIRKHDINVVANYIFGLGNDNWKTMQETLNLALELNTENVNMYCSTPLPGSPLYLKGIRKGWLMPSNYNEYGFLAYEHIPSRTKMLTSSEILEFRDYAFHVYFESPRFLSMIHKKFGYDAVKNIKRMTSIKLKRKLLEN